MIKLSHREFELIVNEAFDVLPADYISGLKNVAITIADKPTSEQMQKLNLHGGQTLFGLYEGIPLTQRNSSYSLVLPDKITIFKDPLLSDSSTVEELRSKVTRTLWHEIAHYYGLDHDRINGLVKRGD